MRTCRVALFTAIALLIVLSVSSLAAQTETPSLITQIGRGSVLSAEWYPNGEFVLIATTAGAWVYTAALEEVAHLPDAHMASLSVDGQVIAATNMQHQLVFWDAVTLRSIAPPIAEWDWFSRITDLAWSPDGRHFVVSGVDRWENNQLYFWNIAEDAEGTPLAHRIPLCTTLLWSHDGSRLAAYTPGQGGILLGVSPLVIHGLFPVQRASTVRWKDADTVMTLDVEDTLFRANEWNALTGENVGTYQLPNDWQAFTPDGRYTARSDWDRIIVQGARAPQFVYESPSLISASQTHFTNLVWSADQRFIAAGTSTSYAMFPADIVVIDIQDSRVLHHWSDALRSIVFLRWSPGDRLLLAVDAHQQLWVYDVQTGERYGHSDAHSHVGMALSWSPDGDHIAIADNLDSVTIRDSQDYAAVFTLPDHPFTVARIDWQPTGERIALEARMWGGGHGGYHTELWELSAASPINITASFQSSSARPISFVRFSQNGDRLAVIQGAEASIWDFTAERPKEILRYLLSHEPNDVFLSPSGRAFLYAADLHGGAAIYRKPDQQRNFWIEVVPFSDRTRTWAHDGALVSVIWDVWDHSYTPQIAPALSRRQLGESGESLWMQVMGFTQFTQRGFVSPFGAYIGAVHVGNDGMIWDGQTGAPITWLSDVADMTWSPDETLLVVQQTNGDLWLLEADGTILARIPTPPDRQSAAGEFYWSPDSRQLAHLHDGVIDMWQIRAA